TGVEQIVNSEISPAFGKSVGARCRTEAYTDVFEITVDRLAVADHALSVDLIQPGSPGLGIPFASVVEQRTFGDSGTPPQALVTLWERMSLEQLKAVADRS